MVCRCMRCCKNGVRGKMDSDLARAAWRTHKPQRAQTGLSCGQRIHALHSFLLCPSNGKSDKAGQGRINRL